MWYEWDKVQPQHGDKVVVFADDLCTTWAGIVVHRDDKAFMLEAEDGFELGAKDLAGCIWCRFPLGTAFLFMQLDRT